MAGRALTLRLKARDGQHVINQLTLESTLEELRSKVSELTKIPARALKILSGFPPKPVDTSDGTKPLSSLSVRSGDTLIVQEDSKAKAPEMEKRSTAYIQEIASQLQGGQGILTRQVVPANNSCLFTSVHFVMEGGKLDLSSAKGMRQLIASIVASDPDTYNDAFLGKTNSDYCDWILNEESWGGAIEISILSKYYGIEIDVVDTQTVRVDRFGEDQNYARRVMLLYDGIHYDPLMLESVDPIVPPITTFSTEDASILSQAMELAAEAKSSRQFTDVGTFALRCLICNKTLKGQTEAQAHAKDTGHINFGEV